MNPILRALAVSISLSAGARAQTGPEAAAVPRLARELDRWTRFLAAQSGGDDIEKQVQDDGRRALALADDALRAGHAWLALQRAAPALLNLAGAAYVQTIPAAQRGDEAAFEAEQARMGGVLADALGEALPGEFAGIEPAALRALAQVARLQARELFGASLDYAQSTEPRFAYFYVGQASGARDLIALCRALAADAAAPAAGRVAPPLRALAPEIERLEDELLAAYAPPRSLLMHGEFIAASALLKEARELDAAGLRDGALLRLMLAALQSAKLRPVPARLEGDALAGALRDLEERVAKRGGDSSLARLFLASAEAARAGTDSNPALAATIAADVLPRWFAALEPAAAAPSIGKARATVTVVRWPFT
jgi:hypothetical protein